MFNVDSYNPLNNPEITRQMQENARNKELQNEIAKTNNAEYIAKIIGHKIVEFQSALSEVQDIVLQIIQFNNSITLYVTGVSHLGMGLVVFQGLDSNNNPCEIVQHINQINVLMAVVPKPAEVPHRKIGF